MTESEFQLLRGAGFALAAVLAVGLQRIAPHAGLRGSGRVNLGLWAVNLGVMTVACGACACTVSRWAAARHVGLLNLGAVPLWGAVPATIIVLDFVSYAWHRANHVVPLLWRFHQVHHSDTTFTASTGVRFHPGELILSLPLRLAAVVVLGAPPAAVVIFETLFAVANLVEHGDIDLSARLEAVVGRLAVTPALHRFHHIRSWPERDSNFGTIFVVWDRVLRTYHRNDSAARIPTGLPGVARGLRLGALLLLPLAGGPIGPVEAR